MDHEAETFDRRYVAKTVRGMRVSAIKEMAMLSARVEGAASLTWGVPSFRTPVHIRAAVERALEEDPNVGKYALPDGLPELRRAAADAHLRSTGAVVDPDRNVLVTAGNMQGLNTLFHVLLDPGDEIILTDPGFASHIQQIQMCGGKSVFWPLDAANGWSLDIEALPGLIGPRTKAILIVTPSNPTGRIFREAQLRQLADIAAAHDLLLLLDDPYSPFSYPDAPTPFNLASATEHADRTAYLFTFSKAHAMSGWRLGYMIVPEWLKRHAIKVHDATMICAPRVSQVAGLAALEGPQDHLREFSAVLERRRRLITERLDALGHVFEYAVPEGAYYVFPKIVADMPEAADSRAFAIRLLEEAKVTVTPGGAFGPSGEGHVRMAFCVDDDAINLAFDRMTAFFGR